jgi:competence protein ComEC
MSNRKSQKNSLRLEVIIIVLVVLLIFFGINYFKGNNTDDGQPKLNLDGQFCMHTIDVGQGDSILITEGEHAILIDAGPGSGEDALLKYLKRANVKKFDYVIATHPHEDHIGGMDKIIENYKIDNFIMTDLPKNMIPNTSCYEKMIDLLLKKKVKVVEAKAGNRYKIGDIKLELLTPLSLKYDNLNNFSIVSKVTFGNIKIVLSGDAEKQVEYDILKKKCDVTCDIYKVGHHGSVSSSTKKFLNAMKPRYAVISCAENNDYGHPHKETIETLKKKNIEYFVTKDSGTVRFISDGNTIKTDTDR